MVPWDVWLLERRTWLDEGRKWVIGLGRGRERETNIQEDLIAIPHRLKAAPLSRLNWSFHLSRVLWEAWVWGEGGGTWEKGGGGGGYSCFRPFFSLTATEGREVLVRLALVNNLDWTGLGVKTASCKTVWWVELWHKEENSLSGGKPTVYKAFG